MSDLISRQAAIRWIKAECNPYGKPTLDYKTSCRIMEHLERMPSAEPKTPSNGSITSMNTEKMHDRTMGDLISRQSAIELIHSLYPSAPIMRMNRKRWKKKYKPYIEVEKALEMFPSAESVKAYTKADYIMALHKEYGCTLTMAEEAHNKALEHLRSKARMKG